MCHLPEIYFKNCSGNNFTGDFKSRFKKMFNIVFIIFSSLVLQNLYATIFFIFLPRKTLIVPHNHQHLGLTVVFIHHSLVCILWDYILVLIYIWLITKDVEHLFVCLVALCKSSLLKYLFKCFACFSLSFWSLLLSCPQQSLIILLMAVVSLMMSSFPFIISQYFFSFS